MLPNRARFGAQNQVVAELPIEAPAQTKSRTHRMFVLIGIMQGKNGRIVLGETVDVNVGVLNGCNRPEHEAMPVEVVTGGSEHVELPTVGRSMLRPQDIAAMDFVAVVSAADPAIDV